MNIKDFFELTGKVRAAQIRYFTGGRLQRDLIASKQLESKLDKALLEGVPEPTVSIVVHTPQEYQSQFALIEPPAEYVVSTARAAGDLDLSGIERPTDGKENTK